MIIEQIDYLSQSILESTGPMNLDRYFERIRYDGDRHPTAQTLRRLHRAHMLAVPFENLSIHIGQRIHLNEDWLFNKIVGQNRGGFCYEQNGLFAAVLRQMGFAVTLHEARVYNPYGELGIRFDHLTLIVQLEERWLTDVGFGESFSEPLRLDDPAPQPQYGETYRVQHSKMHSTLQTQKADGNWHNNYQFYEAPLPLSDFLVGCHYHQTSPDSHFTKKRVCSLLTPSGRVTVSENTLIMHDENGRQEHTLPDETAVTAALQEYFGIVLPSD